MKWQSPRGTKDIMPAEMVLRNKLYDRFRNVFSLYGYGQVETPAFESFDLLSKKSGPDIEDEIYVFEDKKGRKMGLRFDQTVPIARIVATDKSLPKPIRFFYIGRDWRYDRPQAGRYREFWQVGAELIGSRSIDSDLEVLQTVSDLLNSAEVFNFYFRVNSRNILNVLLECLKIENEKWVPCMRILDKKDKISKDELLIQLKSIGLDVKKATLLISFVTESGNMKFPDFKKFFIEEYKIGKKELAWFEEIENLIGKADALGIPVKFDPSIVRGIDYYTGFVFETFVENKEEFGSICSGGRYDSLIDTYGGDSLPAVGFGLGVDRLLDVVNKEMKDPSVNVFVAGVIGDVQDDVDRIVRSLRENKISCEKDIMGKTFKKQIQYASSKNIKYLLIVGPDELEKNEVKLKNMRTGKERNIKIDDITKELS